MFERAVFWGLRASATAAGSLVVFIAVFVASEAAPAFRELGIFRLFGDSGWHPTPSAAGSFNLAPMVVGTLVSSIGAVALAVPLGVSSAVFLHFVASPNVATVYRRIVELLAGIPSVVYGFWGLTALVPLLLELAPPGQNLLAGILILTLMILPTIALMTDSALAAVPAATIQGAFGVGLTWPVVATRIALPAARSGIATGILLAAGRALGETMAVIMVCGNIVQIPGSLLDPIRTLTANIALEMGYASGLQRASLFASGVLLFVMVAAVVIPASRVGRRADAH